MNIGIIGTGYWGKNHVRVFKELMSEEVVDSLILCDINEARGRKFAKIFDVDFVKDYHQLLNDSKLDAVSIVTPSSTHFKIAKEFMEKGKDVFVEKPMTMNLKDAKKLIEIAEKSNQILMVGHIFRYHSAVKELKKRMDRRDFGDIYYMNSSRLEFNAPRRDMGVLFALAIHEVDIFCYLLNEKYPKDIYAITKAYLQPEIEELAIIAMSFENNIGAYAIESWLNPIFGKKRDLIVIGSNLSARVDYLRPHELTLFDASISLYKKDEDITFSLENEGSYVVPIEYKEPLKEELRHFIDCIKSNSMPLSDMYVGARAVEMIEMARESAKKKRVLSLPSDEQ